MSLSGLNYRGVGESDDDTTVPVLAKGKTRTGRLWTYVRDDRPFAGTAAPACGLNRMRAALAACGPSQPN